MCLRSLCNQNLHDNLAVTTGEFRKHLFGRNHLPTISLGDREKQFCFLFWRKGKAALLISGQHSYRCALFQSHALDYDLTADNSSSSYFHGEKNTP